jgi:hypothetical protein
MRYNITKKTLKYALKTTKIAKKKNVIQNCIKCIILFYEVIHQ